jgi:hypothetical protein
VAMKDEPDVTSLFALAMVAASLIAIWAAGG